MRIGIKTMMRRQGEMIGKLGAEKALEGTWRK
jgi:hypothetical protein